MIKNRNKKIIILLILLLIPFSVSAKIDCSTINDEIENYNKIVDNMENLKCDKVTDSKVVSKCNDYNIEKSLSLSKLFSYNDENINCNKSNLKSIINKNKDNCVNIFGTEIKEIVHSVMNIFYIVAPFLLIIFGMIDFSKIVVMSDPKTIKESRRNFVRRLISFILLFFVPVIVNFFLNFNVIGINYDSNVYSCKGNVLFQIDRWETTYVPQTETTSVSDGTSSIVIGGITTDAQAEALNKELKAMLHTKEHHKTGLYQSGPFPKYWSTPYNNLSKFQCTWWANGRASQYLAKNGTKYKKYPTQMGHGGMYYDVNKSNGYFKYGSTPKPNSIISWKKGTAYGHVAYVEGVGKDGIYISHAGSGLSWFGVQKIPLNGNVWPGAGYNLNGYIYLDEPK